MLVTDFGFESDIPTNIQLTVKLNTNITNAISDERVVKLEDRRPHLLQWRNRLGGHVQLDGRWGLRYLPDPDR